MKGLRTLVILKYGIVDCRSVETHRVVLYFVPQKGMKQQVRHNSVSIRIVQLEEHLTVNQRVVGSNPTSEIKSIVLTGVVQPNRLSLGKS